MSQISDSDIHQMQEDSLKSSGLDKNSQDDSDSECVITIG